MGSAERRENLRRLLKPRQVAVIGGREAARVVEQCQKIGYAGELWPVNPRRDTIHGITCYPDLDDLPAAPDAAFIAVPREPTVDLVARLAAMGAGGAVCYASGFAELDDEGRLLQKALVEAAGDLAFVGPNCYGLLNYLDGATLWPDQHGGARTDRGVAIVSQSGNVSLNYSMQRRGLPLGYVISTGNQAGLSLADYVEALVDDPRVSAIGLHIEAVTEVGEFAAVAARALERRVPLVALKVGTSALGASTAMSHTSSLAGSDRLYDDLFARLGIARVRGVPEFLEALKFLAISGPLPEPSLATISCSGGEASIAADTADVLGIAMPALVPGQRDALAAVLGDRVALANPLDYHTYIWADPEKQFRCFRAMMEGTQAVTVKVLDFPRTDRCDDREWLGTYEAFRDAARDAGKPAAVLSLMHENLSAEQARRIATDGITPLFGMAEGLSAVAAAGAVGRAQRSGPDGELPVPGRGPVGTLNTLDEMRSKAMLAARGLPVPSARRIASDQSFDSIRAQADELGYPLVAKALSADLAHKSDRDGVRIDIRDDAALEAAVTHLAKLAPELLIEHYVGDAVAELLVGITVEPPFGPALTLGTGGERVELWADSVTRLLPLNAAQIRGMLDGLKVARLLAGYRGRPAGDIEAAVRAIGIIGGFALEHAGELGEMDINPLLVRPGGAGVVAVDALIRMRRSEQ